MEDIAEAAPSLGGDDINLENFEQAVDSPHILTSPRSLRACYRHDVKPIDLLPRPLEDFHRIYAGLEYSDKEIRQLAAKYETRRQEQLDLVRRERDMMVAESEPRPSRQPESEPRSFAAAAAVAGAASAFSAGAVLRRQSHPHPSPSSSSAHAPSKPSLSATARRPPGSPSSPPKSRFLETLVAAGYESTAAAAAAAAARAESAPRASRSRRSDVSGRPGTAPTPHSRSSRGGRSNGQAGRRQRSASEEVPAWVSRLATPKTLSRLSPNSSNGSLGGPGRSSLKMSLEEADQAVVEAEMERLALETCWLDEVGIGEEHLHTTRSEELDLRIDHRLRKKALEDTLRQLEELEMEDREEMRSWKARMHKEVESKTNQLAEQRRERERRQMLLQESYERNAKTREEEIRRRRLEQEREREEYLQTRTSKYNEHRRNDEERRKQEAALRAQMRQAQDEQMKRAAEERERKKREAAKQCADRRRKRELEFRAAREQLDRYEEMQREQARAALAVKSLKAERVKQSRQRGAEQAREFAMAQSAMTAAKHESELGGDFGALTQEAERLLRAERQLSPRPNPCQKSSISLG